MHACMCAFDLWRCQSHPNSVQNTSSVPTAAKLVRLRKKLGASTGISCISCMHACMHTCVWGIHWDIVHLLHACMHAYVRACVCACVRVCVCMKCGAPTWDVVHLLHRRTGMCGGGIAVACADNPSPFLYAAEHAPSPAEQKCIAAELEGDQEHSGSDLLCCCPPGATVPRSHQRRREVTKQTGRAIRRSADSSGTCTSASSLLSRQRARRRRRRS